MSVAARLAAFAAVLAVAFGAALAAGSAVDPTREEVAAADAGHGEQPAPGAGHDDAAPPAAGDAHAQAPAHDDGDGSHGAAGARPSGLAVADDGFALEVDDTARAAGRPEELRFRIVDDRGRVVRDEFERAHERELHLIVVRRDTAAFQHLHPRKGEDGTWTTELTLPDPGVYRMYADFKLGGTQRTLATDLFVPGDFRPQAMPESRRSAAAGEYRVALSSSRPLEAGTPRTLVFSVERDGAPVRDLQPYLGARGHLVALREGDLAYLHVHPVAGVGGGAVGFEATFPSAGRYRLFLQFRHRGEVRTVAYTVGVRR